ncbi:MAG: hypothetical protein EZS28_036586 [Streblomastix strix]|uniref:Uncharacterized protein n=1 Tax=Streblomastix strix TaxID=222440 RepID=A0A5J4UE56_9EUKA|nr:MAG: hypothetical protein EZS28_036586 [Streblomastix strix]
MNRHRRENLDKEKEIGTLEKERIDLFRSLRKDYIDLNTIVQVDRANPQSPCFPYQIELSNALELDDRLPLRNYENKKMDAIKIKITI